MVGVVPALLVFYIRRSVPESPSWRRPQRPRQHLSRSAAALAAWPLRGRADDRVQLLQPRHAGPLSDVPAGAAQLVAARGRHHRRDLQYWRHLGGLSFGSLSERFGRRRASFLPPCCRCRVMPLWAFSPSAVLLAIGAFLMQVMVQGAWGVIPAHLNELSPDERARDVSRVRLPARQPDRLDQRHAAGRHRHTLRQRLRLRPGAGCWLCGGRDCDSRRTGPGSQGRGVRDRPPAWCGRRGKPGNVMALAGCRH